MRTTIQPHVDAVPQYAVSPTVAAPHTHPSWCRGPVGHITDPGTTLTPLVAEALARHPAVVPSSLGREGLVAYVAPTVYAILDERLGVSPVLLGPNVSLADDLAADSRDLMEVVIDLESVFAIVVPEREIDRVRSVAELVRLVARYLWERDHAEPWRPLVAAA